MPRTRVGESANTATAARVCAVSEMSAMSTSMPRRVPAPVTVSRSAVRATRAPIRSSRSAKRTSPCRLAAPSPRTVTRPPADRGRGQQVRRGARVGLDRVVGRPVATRRDPQAVDGDPERGHHRRGHLHVRHRHQRRGQLHATARRPSADRPSAARTGTGWTGARGSATWPPAPGPVTATGRNPGAPRSSTVAPSVAQRVESAGRTGGRAAAASPSTTAAPGPQRRRRQHEPRRGAGLAGVDRGRSGAACAGRRRRR